MEQKAEVLSVALWMTPLLFAVHEPWAPLCRDPDCHRISKVQFLVPSGRGERPTMVSSQAAVGTHSIVEEFCVGEVSSFV